MQSMLDFYLKFDTRSVATRFSEELKKARERSIMILDSCKNYKSMTILFL